VLSAIQESRVRLIDSNVSANLGHRRTASNTRPARTVPIGFKGCRLASETNLVIGFRVDFPEGNSGTRNRLPTKKDTGETGVDKQNDWQSDYQIKQAFGRIIGCLSLHPKAFANWGMFDTGPFTRHLAIAWGSVET